MELDDALSQLGTWGRWQVTRYIMVSCGTMTTAAWHMLAIVYIGFSPDHHCKIPSNSLFNRTIPIEINSEGVSSYSQCESYINLDVDNSTQPCQDGWTFTGYGGSTVVTQWELVCSKAYLKDLSQTVLVFGVMLGALGFTTLADNFGRKPVFLFSLWAMIIVGTTNAFVTNYYVFMVLRFFTGALQQGIILSGFVMACELFAAKHRSFAGIMIENIWSAAWCIMPLIAYLIQDWRYLQLFISLFGLLSIPMFWLVPESVVWLCANDRADEAEQVIRHAARVNKLQLPEGPLLSCQHASVEEANANDEKKNGGGFIAQFKKMTRTPKKLKGDETKTVFTLLDLFKNRRLRLYAIIMSMLWMVITLVYYGLSLSTATLAGNRYVNAFLSALIEIPAYTSSYFFLQRWGRRYPLIAFHCIAGVSLIMTQLIPAKSGDVSLLPLIIIFNMIGKFGITGAFGIVFLYAPEIFPTMLRGQAMGVASLMGRIGNLAASYAPYVIKHVPWLPAPLFGTLSIVAGLLVILLPETKDRPLPQTIEDIENWSKEPSPPKETKGNPEQELETIDGNAQPSKIV